MYRLLIFIISFSMVTSCLPKTEYEKVKERELASGKIVEELFLDLKFGMGIDMIKYEWILKNKNIVIYVITVML